MTTSRLQAYFSACVRKVTERVNWAGVYRYSVVSCDFANQTLSANPLTSGVPSLTAIPMSVPGVRLDVAPGAVVYVGFAELNPTLPYVASYPQDPAAILRMEFRGGTTGIALQGMSVEVTVPSSAFGTFGAGALPCPSAPVTVQGTITEGSATLRGTP